VDVWRFSARPPRRLLAESVAVPLQSVDDALLTLESEGVDPSRLHSPRLRELEWCERRLLARIHRYTLNRLRAEICARESR
jgi:ATP-dependent Lhr-like helicase